MLPKTTPVSTRRILLAVLLTVVLFQTPKVHSENVLATNVLPALEIQARPGEAWWLGVISKGHLMPLEAEFQADFTDNVFGNQVQPLLLSSQGRGVWSEEPYQVNYEDGRLSIHSEAQLVPFKAGHTLREAYLHASAKFFPPAGILPEEMLFTHPQYNTWIELMYDQNQKDILKYARAIVDQGFPPGVLMIDDNWQADYGKWDFHPGRFPDPKAMMAELHGMGFKVMLWVCPFVSPDCDVYRSLEKKGALLRERTASGEAGPPKIVRWWNGASAVLDLSNRVDKAWFKERLDHLQNEYKVDGFKLDAGDAEFYPDGHSQQNVSANEQNRLFGEIGLHYRLNEYRAMWQMGGQPLVQRLRDKGHKWADLRQLIPQMSLASLMGYPFSCPDMIGGGEYKSFLSTDSLDQELIVRSTQVHALMPMMQFSVAPWRVLDQTHLKAVKSAVELRAKFADYILETAKQSAQTGEPILRPLAYDYPNMQFENLKTQFLIGADLLVAPVLEPQKRQRQVHIPPGVWQSANGTKTVGPKSIVVSAELDELPYFQKVDNEKVANK